MQTLWKQHRISIMLFILISVLYSTFAYAISRTDVYLVIAIWITLFASTYYLIARNTTINSLALAALGFRMLFVLAIPNLSQDFYRFLWDGRLLLAGYNPYLSLPEVWISQGNTPIAQAQELYNGMGTLNGSHFTNYPPISQFCYGIAAFFAGKSILGGAFVLRLLIIAADVGTFFFGRKLLKALQLPEKNIFWYILNPFVIIELTGNLHFEAVMVFFIIWALYLLHKGYWYWAAVALGLSVTVKLIPLLFLPLLFQKLLTLGAQKENKHFSLQGIGVALGFYTITLGTILVLFLPFLSIEFLANFSKTISLWFQNFEFNASIYYMIRWIGYQTIGWNIIGTVGKILPLVVIGILLILSFFRKNQTTVQLITVLMLGVCTYYFLSTTVHPWYLAVPLSLCIFTRYKFPILWSLTIILSYTAYIHPQFSENLWMVALEYLVVFGIFMVEIIKNTTLISLPSIYAQHQS